MNDDFFFCLSIFFGLIHGQATTSIDTNQIIVFCIIIIKCRSWAYCVCVCV